MQLSLAPTVAAPARARAAVTTWLGHEPHDPALIEVALLLVSELVTNCVRHARITAAHPLQLTASLGTTSLRLELWDNGTDGTVARRTPQRDDPAGGFGLDLVARLSSAWGSDRDAHGTTVWLELPIPADLTAPNGLARSPREEVASIAFEPAPERDIVSRRADPRAAPPAPSPKAHGRRDAEAGNDRDRGASR